MRLGGFIITYNRPQILSETIKILFDQTVPPVLLWIIDNSDNLDTDHAIASLLDSRLRYHRMGYNAGPAGAAKQGLQLCADSGLDWIYWGDDNDPPQHTDTFEKLLSIKDDNPYCAILGAVGQFFDHKKGEIKRVQSRLLERKNSLEVDFIAGNMNMIVHKNIVKAGIYPDPDLFFGFEELDFCLKAKRRGFAMLVHCGLFLALREKHNRINFEPPFYKRKSNLAREYYSLRNLLYISDGLTLDTMKRSLIRKWVGKSFYGFRYGPKYGFQNGKMIILAFLHYYKGIKGKTIDL
jgi:GT2 family glycosyltransferase